MMTVAYSVALKGSTLPVPSECPEPFGHIMQECWQQSPRDRLVFAGIQYAAAYLNDFAG